MTVDESGAITVCLPIPCKHHEPDCKHQTTIQVANSCNIVLLSLQYDIYMYNSPILATFFHSAPLIPVGIELSTSLLPQDISNYEFDQCLPIVLTSEIGCGATGIVYHSTLQLEGYVPLDVIVKLAFNSDQSALRNEYTIYHNLKQKGVLRGITTVLGFFNDWERGPCALVMLYAGVSLTTEPEHVLPASNWWVSDHNLSTYMLNTFY